MGTYFTNETLDALWVRLVNATEKLISSTPSTNKVILEETNMEPLYIDEWGTAYNYYSPDADIFDQNLVILLNGAQYNVYLPSEDFIPGSSMNIVSNLYYGELNAAGHYLYVEDYATTVEIYVEASNDIPSLSNTGIKGIHDALLSHYNLSHENTPTTPGDYMKGIAVAARYKKYGTEEPDMLWSLEQIVEELEGTSSELPIFTLDETLSLTASEGFVYYGDLYLTLYKDGEYFGSIFGADGTVPFDFLNTGSWVDQPPPTFSTGTYYATIGWYSDEGYTQYNSAKSNEIYIADVPTRYRVVLNTNGDYSLTPSTGDATLVLYDITTQESQTIISAGPVGSGNLSEYMITGHQYYVEVNSISADPDYGTYRSETITYSGPAITVTLSQDGIASSNITTDPDWYLYNAETDELIHTVNASLSPVDFSSHMTPGNQYYVIVQDIQSNTITYSGNGGEEPELAVSVTLNSSGIATVIYTGFTPASANDVYWTLYNEAGEYLVYDSTYDDSIYTHDFSSYMTNGALYKVGVSAYTQSIDSTIDGSSDYVEYLSSDVFDAWISATLSKTQLSDDIRFNVNYSYSSSDLYIEGALVTLFNDTLSETVVSDWRAPTNGNTPDIASFAFLATDLHTDYAYDNHYILTVTTYENIPADVIWNTTSIEFTWPFGQGGGGSTTPSYSGNPDASMTTDGYIYVSNYSTEEYNGSDAIVYASWSDVDGGSQTETELGSLSYGYVMLSDGVYFEGEPYMSEVSYSIVIRDPNDETNSTAEVRVTKPLD